MKVHHKTMKVRSKKVQVLHTRGQGLNMLVLLENCKNHLVHYTLNPEHYSHHHDHSSSHHSSPATVLEPFVVDAVASFPQILSCRAALSAFVINDIHLWSFLVLCELYLFSLSQGFGKEGTPFLFSSCWRLIAFSRSIVLAMLYSGLREELCDFFWLYLCEE